MPTVSASRPLAPSHSVVDDATELQHYWGALLRAWGVRSGTRKASSATYFPGANPCSVSRADLATIHSAPHVATLKSDGVRYALFLTTRPSCRDETLPVALMIDRARNMYEVEVLAPEDYFLKDTLLEGELVWCQPNERILLYLVFDAVCIAGVSYLHRSFEERLDAAVQCTRLSEELAASSDAETRVAETGGIAMVHFDPPITMRPKRFVDAVHASRIWAERGDAAHRVDGLILHRSDCAYVYGTAAGAVYKWKPRHTIDLSGPPTALRAADGLLGETIGEHRVVVRASRVVVRDGEVAEYDMEVQAPNTVTLFATRTRPDKRTANGLRVIAATLRDAMENLIPEDLA